jgi:riboflavin synthase
MFTGIITDVGEVVAIKDHGSAKRIAIACSYPLEGIQIGASIANAGICLTVTTLAAEADGRTRFTVDASSER